MRARRPARPFARSPGAYHTRPGSLCDATVALWGGTFVAHSMSCSCLLLMVRGVAELFVFLIMVNIFLAILNDSYLAIKEIFNADEIEEVEAPPTLRERLRTTMTWLRQRQLDRRIEHLRKQQRVQQLAQQREENRKEEMRAKLLRAMGADVTTLDREIERKQKEAQTHLRQGVEHES